MPTENANTPKTATWAGMAGASTGEVLQPRSGFASQRQRISLRPGVLRSGDIEVIAEDQGQTLNQQEINGCKLIQSRSLACHALRTFRTGKARKGG